MKTCGCNTPCGCGQNVWSQKPPCSSGYPSCDDPEICSETFDGACTVYTGPTIINLDIPKGTRVNEALQRLVGAIVNPGCNYSDSPCKSVIVTVKKITNNTIALKWGSAGSGVSYQINYRKTSDVNWTTNTATTSLSDTIGGLVPNTAYHVRVATLCDNACYSLTFSITTKA